MTRPVCILTGAGSGIGRAAAIGLSRAGFAVTLAGRNADHLRDTAALFEDGAPSLVCPTDVAEPSQLRRLVDSTVERFGCIDVLVNNAGYAGLVNLADLTPPEVKKTLDVNLAGPMLLTAAAWPHLAARNGLVVNVSSMASRDPFPGLRAYGAAKAAINLFTKGIAAEGLRAVAILPGAVETPLLRSLFDEKDLPAAAAMPPERIADVIVACATGQCAFDNGGQIIISGEPS